MINQTAQSQEGNGVASDNAIAACHSCGLIHRLPIIGRRQFACCVRCRSVIHHQVHPRSMARAGALASAALVLYPLALWLPVMEIERFGHVNTVSVWSGMAGLLSEGHLFVGVAVLVFSVIAPIGKLGSLFILCKGQRLFSKMERAQVYRFVEFVGKWGMVDVMLVAVLVAVVKLGAVVTVTPGPGVVVFGSVVLLSLLASSVFEPRAIWDCDQRVIGASK